jgi:hypothetical protein
VFIGYLCFLLPLLRMSFQVICPFIHWVFDSSES